MRKRELVVALREQRGATIRRLAGLDDEAWDQPTAAPSPRAVAPTVREVAAHLIVVDQMLLRRPVRGMRGVEHRWDDDRIAALAARTPGELLAGLARRGETVVRVAAGTASALTPLTLPGWSASRSVVNRWQHRVVHEWLHEYDVSRVAGPPAVPRQAVAGLLIDSVLRSIQLRVLPRTETTAGVVKLIIDAHPSLAEPADAPARSGVVPPAEPGRRTWSVDFARRHFGPRVTAMPDATVWVHVTALAVLAGGRASHLRLQPQLLVIDGDAELAGALLDAIAGCVSESSPVWM